MSAATDLYAFGCLLFQMLTGRVPYGGPDFVSQHLGAEVPAPSRVRAGVPEAFDAVIAAFLAKDPEARPQDVSAARALLASVPWDVPHELAPVRVSQVPSLPTAGVEEGSRLVPSIHRAGAWTDRRLLRDVQRLLVSTEAMPLVRRWAGGALTALQPVYEVVESDDGRMEVWVQPLTAETPLHTVEEPARTACLRALATLGVGEERARGLRVAWGEGREAIVPLAEVLRGMGMTVEIA